MATRPKPEPEPNVDELLDEESLAVLAILLAVALEFGFGFAKTVAWWTGLVAGPAALGVLVALFRLQRTHVWLVRIAAWAVRSRAPKRDDGVLPPTATASDAWLGDNPRAAAESGSEGTEWRGT